MEDRPVWYAAAGESIFSQGGQGKTAFLIESGEVEISTTKNGRKLVISRLGPGEIFGELALFSDQPRSASAKATCDSELAIITPETLRSAINSADPVLASLIRCNLGRFAWTQRYMLQHAAPSHSVLALDSVAASERQTEIEISTGIAESQFRNFYQPIFSSETGEIAGFEALLRWYHPTRGLVTPGSFVNVAEQTGQIIELGSFALREALKDLRRFQDRLDNSGGKESSSPLFMSVNLSVRQLLEPREIDRLVEIVRDSGVAPELIKLEITESLLVDDPAHAPLALEHIRSTGVKLAIDDFGTGYSSLSYLHLYPLDTLKIDRSFVQGVRKEPRRMRILRAIVHLARDLGFSVVAEGIETEDELQAIRELECDLLQGFLLSKPIPAELILTRLQRGSFSLPFWKKELI
ncbi:EAL domain-containing protein [Marinobacter sp. MMG032]|uniref:EAL domain-containing protein n=1 Tax=Marinobacter sp. MMG032 TaxID=3158548 RepID=A0AAU7MLC0_9GAMM